MPSVLALSPHLDDAAFSAGGTLARLTASGWNAEVVTVFTASVPNPRGFALDCQLDKGLPVDVDYMALRRAEDATACEALGARPTWLTFREAPHRGYESAPELFGPRRYDNALAKALEASLASLISNRIVDLILAPQAVGGHVDHVELVSALQRLGPKQPVLWWADWPYAARAESHPARPFEAVMMALPNLALDVDVEPKRAACAAYVTQVGYQFPGACGLDIALAATGGVERFRAQGDAAALLAPLAFLSLMEEVT